MNRSTRKEVMKVLKRFSKEELHIGWLDRDERICRVLQHLGELDWQGRDLRGVEPHIFVWNGWILVRDFYDKRTN